jgi:hypothetical protein
MGKDSPWTPGDGAEQVNPAPGAQQHRAATAHFTPQHRSDEPEAERKPVDSFDPAYSAWRGANGSHLDSDYLRWRAETGQPFSDSFLGWAAEEARKRKG